MKIRHFFYLLALALFAASCAPSYNVYQKPTDNYVPVEQANPAYKHVPNNQARVATPPPPPAPTYADELNTAKDANYMTERERQMIVEVNLMRSNPAGYVKYVKEFQKTQMARIHASSKGREKAATDELIAVLKKTAPLPLLSPHQALQKSVEKHAAYSKKVRYVDHYGENDSDVMDRAKQETSEFAEVAENIVGGPYPVREALIILLIDRDVPDRGHRDTLLDGVWEYISCADLGNSIQRMPNSWIQNFARAKDNVPMSH